ncbi:MAG: hypothetical protein KDA66_15845, partial [Planctomycetaceae bacterium]|nr:hypothetical protein [Planctomycetaceae bacterium]
LSSDPDAGLQWVKSGAGNGSAHEIFSVAYSGSGYDADYVPGELGPIAGTNKTIIENYDFTEREIEESVSGWASETEVNDWTIIENDQHETTTNTKSSVSQSVTTEDKYHKYYYHWSNYYPADPGNPEDPVAGPPVPEYTYHEEGWNETSTDTTIAFNEGSVTTEVTERWVDANGQKITTQKDTSASGTAEVSFDGFSSSASNYYGHYNPDYNGFKGGKWTGNGILHDEYATTDSQFTDSTAPSSSSGPTLTTVVSGWLNGVFTTATDGGAAVPVNFGPASYGPETIIAYEGFKSDAYYLEQGDAPFPDLIGLGASPKKVESIVGGEPSAKAKDLATQILDATWELVQGLFQGFVEDGLLGTIMAPFELAQLMWDLNIWFAEQQVAFLTDPQGFTSAIADKIVSLASIHITTEQAQRLGEFASEFFTLALTDRTFSSNLITGDLDKYEGQISDESLNLLKDVSGVIHSVGDAVWDWLSSFDVNTAANFAGRIVGWIGYELSEGALITATLGVLSPLKALLPVRVTNMLNRMGRGASKFIKAFREAGEQIMKRVGKYWDETVKVISKGGDDVAELTTKNLDNADDFLVKSRQRCLNPDDGCFIASTPVWVYGLEALQPQFDPFGTLSWEGTETEVATSVITETQKPIAQVALGSRVRTANPQFWDVDREFDEPDETWLEIHVHVSSVDGTSLDVELLRPREWVEARDLRVGG